MKNAILLIAILGFGLSCDRFPDPSFDDIKNFSFGFNTVAGRKFAAGEWVGDTIRFRAVNNNNPMKDSVRVLFDIVTGDGQLTVQSTYTDKKGFAYTQWKLGSASSEQILRANSYDLMGNYLTSTDLSEYVFLDDQWNKYTGSTDGSMSGLVADKVNNVTFMIANGSLYKQSEIYYNWTIVNTLISGSVRTINIDLNGIIYVSTGEGEIFRSDDHGESWKKCDKPYADRPYYIFVYISNDNYVWVYAWDHQTKYSNDGGETWIELAQGAGLTAQGFGDIFRLKDGSILYHGGNCCNMNRSFDNGLTWSKIETPRNSDKVYVNDKDEIFICAMENGIAIYKSTDYGMNFERIYYIYTEYYTSLDNTFNKYGNFYYILIPGYGILKTDDLADPDHYTGYYSNSNLINLFIDHKGDLIGKDRNNITLYYRKNPSK